MKNGKFEKAHSIKIGIKKLTLEYLDYQKNKTANTNLLNVNKNSRFSHLLNDLKESLKNTFSSFTSDKCPLILTGNVELFNDLDKFLKGALSWQRKNL